MRCIAKIIAMMNLKTTKLNACQVTVKIILEMLPTFAGRDRHCFLSLLQYLLSHSLSKPVDIISPQGGSLIAHLSLIG